MPPRRSSRAAAAPSTGTSAVASKARRSTRTAVLHDSDEEDKENMREQKKTKGGKKKTVVEEEEEEEDVEEEEEEEEEETEEEGEEGNEEEEEEEEDDEDDEDDEEDEKGEKDEGKDEQAEEKGAVELETEDDDATPRKAPLPGPTIPNSLPSTPTRVRRPAQAPSSPASPEKPKARLTIHKMALVNFKSYAGRQEIGPFHKSFSSIVGPNGSGKSNTIDALLFVFGYRANKMRQGKLSELIHNSAKYPNLDSCSVEIHFREIIDLPGDNFEVVPDSRLVIARIAFKSNASKYTINGRASSFTEVRNLLKGRGIDIDHNRFLILQGEVESIAQMKPKGSNEHEDGLLEYLEDIIGTSSYKLPIEEALKEVDELNEQRAEKLSRVKLVEKEKEALEGKKRDAEAFLRDQNELAQRQSALWQKHVLESRDHIDVASKAIQSLKAQLADESEKNADSRAEIEELEKQFKAISKDYDVLAKETEKVVKELSAFEREDVQLQEKKKHLVAKLKKANKSLADDKHAKSEAIATAQNSGEEIDKVGKELQGLEESLVAEERALEDIRDSLKEKTQGFSSQIEIKQKELQPWTAKIAEKQAALDVAKEERDLLADKTGSITRAVDDAVEAVETLRAESKAKHQDLARLSKEKVEVERRIAECRKEIEAMRARDEELRSKAASARQRADEARASRVATRTRGDVLNSLTRQKDLGMLKGFHDRLGNLGTIADEYDVAISTACPGLDNIVVDTVETGQQCIEYLRKNNLGRANFIVLNALARSNLDRIQTPENVPRLFDLVKPKDTRFAPAFYHQLRDTLVARDLNQANRIAYGGKRWRVVTLDGQLIDKSGTMSGGGTRVAKGGMSSKLADDFSPEMIAKLEKERDIVELELHDFQGSRQRLEDELAELTARLPVTEMEMEKIEMDLTNGERRIAEAHKRIEELKRQSKPEAGDVKRMAELEKVISFSAKDIESLSTKASAIEEEIKGLQEKILQVGGVRLRSQKSKVDGIREMIDLATERMTKAEVAKSKAEKDIVKLEKAMGAAAKTVESLQEEMDALEASINDKATAVAAVRARVERAQDAMEEKREQKEGTKAALDEKSELINKFRALEMEVKQKLEDNERTLADNEKRVKHWQEQLSQLELHQIDDDGDEETSGNEEHEPERFEPQELQEYSEDELRGMNKETLKAEIAALEDKVEKGQGNLSVLQEYRRRENEFLSRAKDLEQITELRDNAKNRYDSLRKQRLEEFMAGFSIISSKLKEMYQMITLGGNAELELVDSLDPFSEGIIFSVMPPKKSWKNISNLSGGEKTLSSLALVFALHVFKPTPLYVMDEIDAALDFKNVSIIANYIKERTSHAQFVIISLRNNMFELANRLVGIYKTANCTKSIAIDNTVLGGPPPPPALAPATPARSVATFGMRSVAGTPARGVPFTPSRGVPFTPANSRMM